MSTRTHMVKSFDDELNQLKTQLAALGKAAGAQLKYAVKALRHVIAGWLRKSSTRTHGSIHCRKKLTTCRFASWPCVSRWPLTCALSYPD